MKKIRFDDCDTEYIRKNNTFYFDPKPFFKGNMWDQINRMKIKLQEKNSTILSFPTEVTVKNNKKFISAEFYSFLKCNLPNDISKAFFKQEQDRLNKLFNSDQHPQTTGATQTEAMVVEESDSVDEDALENESSIKNLKDLPKPFVDILCSASKPIEKTMLETGETKDWNQKPVTELIIKQFFPFQKI